MRKFFCFLRSGVSPISTIKQDRESGVVSLCWSEIPDQKMIMNLNILAATIRSFKMLIDYTSDLNPPCPLSLKRKRRRRNCFKIPTSTGIVVAHVIANNPSKLFHLHLGTNFLSVKSSQSLNEIHICRLQPESVTKVDFFRIFLSSIVSSSRHMLPFDVWPCFPVTTWTLP